MITPNLPTEKELRRKAARKARPGGGAKWINLPRNWAHQALSYMDAGELGFRCVVQGMETALVWVLLTGLFAEAPRFSTGVTALLLVHTWNWVTNGLFWVVITATFPGLRNQGAEKTVRYLNEMRGRLAASDCISGVAIYGSVSRHKWHDRSDIDIRFLRRKGTVNLLCSGLRTMYERFLALLARQPIDLYLADDVDFLGKMRSDEVPLLLLARDDRLYAMYPGNEERALSIEDLIEDGARKSRPEKPT